MQLMSLFSGRKGTLRTKAEALHEAILAGALRRELYEKGMAVDTFDGRFESACLHGALIMRHLRETGEPGRELAQALYEALFAGFDYSYRETGVGDSSISRKVRALGERFFGLARGLDSALESENPEDIAQFIERNGLGAGANEGLMAYLCAADKSLNALGEQLHEAENIKWPDP